jgi:prepilin-type N-terminal cleavage/methylation domain-containing protein/prepilin-type processing-associated H-X9-DG protein
MWEHLMHQRKVTGFTLIEILIVISIIALLAAILFPVFSRAKENARRASCQSNLKQIGLALQQYMADYDGIYAPVHLNRMDFQTGGGGGSDGYQNVPSYYDLLMPYVKSDAVFVCPSDERPSVRDRSQRQIGRVGYSRIFSYGLNVGTSGQVCQGPGRPYGDSDSFPGCVPFRDSALSDPARVIYAGDGHGRSSTLLFSWYLTNASDSDINNARVDFRHLETANFLFCDGHVKALRNGVGLGTSSWAP